MQISPELRKNLVYELIRNDLFLLDSDFKDHFLLELLDLESAKLQHSLLSVLSIFASTLKGVDYLLTNGKIVLVRLIEMLKNLN